MRLRPLGLLASACLVGGATFGFAALTTSQTAWANSPSPLATIASGLSDPSGVAVKGTADIEANYGAGTIEAWSPTAVSLYGKTLAANTWTTVASGLSGPYGLALGPSSDLYISTENNNEVSVLGNANGTVFGKTVTKGAVTTLVSSGLSVPSEIATDAAGDLFIDNWYTSNISVLPAASGTLFGKAVTANSLSVVVSTGISYPLGIALDASGNLYVTSGSSVLVLPNATGSLFGRSVTADTFATLVSGLSTPSWLAFDSSGDLYVAARGSGTVSIFPVANGEFFQVGALADTLTTLLGGQNNPSGIAFDSLGNLYFAQTGAGTIDELSQPPAITSLSPVDGPANTTSTVTVTSNTPVAGDSADVNGTPIAFTVTGTYTMNVTFPAQAPGIYPIELENNSGITPATSVNEFPTVLTPTVDSISPSSGPNNTAQTITITGTGFPGSSVEIGGQVVTSSWSSTSPNTMTAHTSGLNPGVYNVQVGNSYGLSPVVAADVYTSAGILSVSPNSGTNDQALTITTTNGLFPTDQVTINGQSLSYSWSSTTPNTVTAYLDGTDLSPGTYDILLYNGTYSQPTPSDEFTITT